MADHESQARVVAQRVSDPGRNGSAPRGQNADSPEAHGAALGILGIDGWFAWRDRRRLRSATNEVSPLTWRGTHNVLMWLAGLAALARLGALLLPGPTFIWFLPAFGVMVLVARRWDRRSEHAAEQSSAEP